MATRIPTGYGPRAAKLFFDGNESKYELWEMKFLGYLRIQHLHQIILSPTNQSDDMDFIEKNVNVFTKLIQYLDDKSLSLVIRDVWDNGRKALTILREHYLSKGKKIFVGIWVWISRIIFFLSYQIFNKLKIFEFLWLLEFFCSKHFLL